MIIKKLEVQKLFALAFLLFSLFILTEFAFYVFPVFRNIYWSIVFSFFIIFILLTKKIDIYIVLYLLLLLIGFLIVMIVGRNAHGTLFVPVLAYVCFYIQRRVKIDFYIFSLNVIIFLLIFSLIELSVKTGLLRSAWIVDFIKNTGGKRMDSLRARGPFGSPLSLSAICVYLTFYFLYIRKSNICLFGSILLVALSGSRTAMALCIILWVSSFSLKGVNFKRLFIIISIIGISVFIILYFSNLFGMGEIFKRVFSLKSYHATSDESFMTRGNTTLKTAMLVLDQFPRTLFFPINTSYISDSAIIGIAAGSSIFLALVFLFMILFSIYNLKMAKKSTYLLTMSIMVLALMVGDAFVPAASFYLFSMLYFKAS